MTHKEEDDDDEISGRPLSTIERRAVRKMIENEARIQWFWGSVRVWAGWISGLILAGWTFIEIFNAIWKRST